MKDFRGSEKQRIRCGCWLWFFNRNEIEFEWWDEMRWWKKINGLRHILYWPLILGIIISVW